VKPGNTGANNLQHRKDGKRKTIVIVAEGAHDSELNKISASMVKDILSDKLKLDTRVTTLGHVQRGGPACAYDRWLSSIQGAEAVRAVLDATPETPSPMIAIDENKIVRKPLVDAVKLTNQVTAAIEAKEFQKAMALRDAEFKEYYESFLMTTQTDQPEMRLPAEKVSHAYVDIEVEQILILHSACELVSSMLELQLVV